MPILNAFNGTALQNTKEQKLNMKENSNPVIHLFGQLSVLEFYLLTEVQQHSLIS
jgi:hypothetical protein